MGFYIKLISHNLHQQQEQLQGVAIEEEKIFFLKYIYMIIVQIR